MFNIGPRNQDSSRIYLQRESFEGHVTIICEEAASANNVRKYMSGAKRDYKLCFRGSQILKNLFFSTQKQHSLHM